MSNVINAIGRNRNWDEVATNASERDCYFIEGDRKIHHWSECWTVTWRKHGRKSSGYLGVPGIVNSRYKIPAGCIPMRASMPVMRLVLAVTANRRLDHEHALGHCKKFIFSAVRWKGHWRIKIKGVTSFKRTAMF